MATSSSAARAHMAAYFRQEAKEKAEEIEQRTEAEFQAIFAERIKLASRVVHEEAERKKKEKVVLKRIERSRAHTETRVKRMEERNKIMKQVKTECLTELAHVSKNAKYPQLCMYLIVQGLMTITETQVALQCREEDLKIVEAQIEPAMKLYQDFVFAQTGIRPKVQIEVNRSVFLPAAPVKGEMRLSCCGGVILSAREGKIVCRNTLDSRLDLCFESLVPQIRGLLFGIRELKPSVPSEIEEAHNHIKAKLQKAEELRKKQQASTAQVKESKAWNKDQKS